MCVVTSGLNEGDKKNFIVFQNAPKSMFIIFREMISLYEENIKLNISWYSLALDTSKMIHHNHCCLLAPSFQNLFPKVYNVPWWLLCKSKFSFQSAILAYALIFIATNPVFLTRSLHATPWLTMTSTGGITTSWKLQTTSRRYCVASWSHHAYIRTWFCMALQNWVVHVTGT